MMVRQIAFSLFACFVLGFLTSPSCSPADELVGSVIDLTKPRSWDSSVQHAREEVAGIARALISVANDKKRDQEDRRQAIFLLGKIQTKEAARFLVANISLELPLEKELFDSDSMKGTPCYYALYMFNDGNWDLARAILDSLEKPPSDIEMSYLSSVVRRIVGVKLGSRLIDDELAKRPEGVRKENLESMKKLLPMR